MSKYKAPMTAKELMDQLAADPEYQQIRAKKNEKSRRLREQLELIEQRMLIRLEEAGFSGDSIESIVKKYAPLPAVVVGILLECLKECSEGRIQESLVRALGAAEHPFDGQLLTQLFAATSSEGLRFAILNTIALIRPTSIEELLETVRENDYYRQKLADLGYDLSPP